MLNSQNTDIEKLKLQIAGGNEHALKVLYDFFSERLFHFANAIIHSKENIRRNYRRCFYTGMEEARKNRQHRKFSLISLYCNKKYFPQLFAQLPKKEDNQF